MRSRFRAALLTFLIVPPLFVFGQTGEDKSIPPDPNSVFRIGVSSFRGEGLSTDNEYLLQALPQLLLQTVSSLKEHQFNAAEISAYQRSLLDGAIAAQRVQINTLFQARSKILFQNADPGKALQASTTAIDSAESRLRFLEALDPTTIDVEKSKPIELAKGPGGAGLLAEPSVSPEQTAKENKLGLLVWGSVDQVEDYLVVHIQVYDTAFGRSVYNYTKTLSPSNVLNAASDVSNQLVKAALGRDFGNLALEVKPAGAMVYLDGSFYGIGGATIRYLTTGAHRVDVRSPGYDSKTVTIFIAPFATATNSIALVEHKRREVVVNSAPAGADVYVASEWKGTTPLSLPLPASDEALVLRRSGYHDYTTTINQQTNAKIDVQLVPDIFKSQDYIAGLRNRFYRSFGAFALSMIAPVSFYSLMQDNLLNLQTTTSATEVARLKREISVWYYAYLGGAFISSTLFANMVIDISDYLRAIH